MLLYYIRHGDPIYTPDSLTELGLRQAEAIAKRLSVHGIDEIYASTSNRAIQTATPTAQLLKKEITTLDWAHESLAYNDVCVKHDDGTSCWAYADQNMRNLFTSPEMAALGLNWHTHPALADTPLSGGVLRIRAHAHAFLARQGYLYDEAAGAYRFEQENNKRIAIFAHHGFGQAFISSILDIPYPLFCTRFNMGHSAMTVIELRHNRELAIPDILTYSNDSHLYKEGLPTRHVNRIYI